MRAPLSERFERSSPGQLLISIVVILVLACEVATHLPPSAVQRSVGDPAEQVVRILASEQAWGVFAPNPRASSIGLYAVVTYEDGETATWTLPDGPRIGANLRYYRWRKWLERARSDSYRDIWEPTARWIADELDDRASPVAKVDLVRRFRDNEVVGPQPAWREFTYFSLTVGEADR